MSTRLTYTFGMSQFLNKFRKDIVAVAWFFGALFLALSLASYSPSDFSFNSRGSGGPVQNFCGYFGSILADLFLQGFGVASWAFPLAGFRISYLTYRGQKQPLTKGGFAIFLLCLLNITSLISLYASSWQLYGGAIWGSGVIGGVVVSVLQTLFNSIGTAVLLLASGLMFFIYYTQQTLSDTLSVPHQQLRRVLIAAAAQVKEKLKQRRTAQRQTNLQNAVRNEAKTFRLAEVQTPAVGKTNGSSGQAEEAVNQEEPSSRNPEILISEALQESEDRNERRLAALKKIQRRVANWELPKVTLIEPPPTGGFKVDQKLIAKNTQLLEDKLAQFNVGGQVVAVRPGPAVTMFEFKPNADVKISRITELADDLALALSSESLRIIAPLPGRDVVGIETSNPKRETVYVREVLEDPGFWDEKNKLPLALGKQANGDTKVVDLRRMPHLLVAGTTGSGKSVFVVSAITGLLFRHSPKTLRLILVDPKQVDLAAFNDVPHLLMPPIREAKKAVTALKWAIREMDKRYRSMSKFGARGLESFNEIVTNLSKADREKHEEAVLQLDETAPNESYYCHELPYIVVVVEEFGDLMAVDKNNVEHSVVRLAQMARACGIHLILAMQSPRKDVITGLIKTNIPGRISFKVASKMDSRIILDEAGAERLLANGDMLFQAPGIGKPERHHGGWLPEKDIQAVVSHWTRQGTPEYETSAMKMLDGSGGGYDLDGVAEFEESDEGQDEMYDEVLAWVAGQKEVSASLLQRKYRLGYPRAARMIEIFEKEGVVGPANGSKPRQVLVSKL